MHRTCALRPRSRNKLNETRRAWCNLIAGSIVGMACGDQDATLVWQEYPSAPAAATPAPPLVQDEPARGQGGTRAQPPHAEPSNDSPKPAPGRGDGGAPSSIDDERGDEPTTPPAPVLAGLDVRPDAAELSLPTSLELASPGWIAEEAFPGLTFDDPVSIVEANGTNHLFVTERQGRIYAFENDPATTEKRLVLDLSGRTQGEHDCGLLGLAFHPEFGQTGSPNSKYLYLHYAYNATPIVGQAPAPDTPTVSRLSRFTLDAATLVADLASEVVLIDQADQSVIHQGGAMFFHPGDGFLYLAVGDEGGAHCSLANCQRISKDLFSGVLRIDVDMKGGEVSHPIVRQPTTGVTANYFIPNDNPFVGQQGVLEEFYALGLRSPHRMTYDAVDDIAWIGEVGQSQREELNVLQKAANYQWSALEGTVPGRASVPTAPIGNWTAPVLELERLESQSIIGGYVYRGTRNPSLHGKYIFGDFITGNIWALSYSYDGANTAVLNRSLLLSSPFRGFNNGITSFGVDRQGELYVLTLGPEAKIYQLGRTGGFSNVPQHLSETGVFVDTSSPSLRVVPGLVPYDVQSPLWSDGTQKLRWVNVPTDKVVGFSQNGAWDFPSGTVFVKHFELVSDADHPSQTRRLETRLLVHGDGNYYGISYKWNDAGTDAELLLEAQTEPINVRLAGNTTRELKYLYPGPSDCNVCHNVNAGPVLGARTAQLNHDTLYEETGRIGNQVFTWGQIGLLGIAPDADEIRKLVSLTAIDDESAPLEERIRSYWESNCSMCHGSIPGIAAKWDARYEVPLPQKGVVMAPAESATDENALLIAPGVPEESVLFLRSSSRLPGFAMPPLARSVPDPAYVSVLRQWVQSLGSNPP